MIVLFAIPFILVAMLFSLSAFVRRVIFVFTKSHDLWPAPEVTETLGAGYRGAATRAPGGHRTPWSVRIVSTVGIVAGPLLAVEALRRLEMVRERTAFIRPDTYEWSQPLMPTYRCDAVDLSASTLTALEAMTSLAVVVALLVGLLCWLLPERTPAQWRWLRLLTRATALTAIATVVLPVVAMAMRGPAWIWWVPRCVELDGRVVSFVGIARPTAVSLAIAIAALVTAWWIERVRERAAFAPAS